MQSARWAARLGLASAVLLAGGCLAVLAANAANNRKLLSTHPGESAPDFSLPIAAGDDQCDEVFHLASRRGSIVVAYFCSTQCPVSNDYEQRLTDLERTYANDPRVVFVAIHTERPPVTSSTVAARSQSAGQRFTRVIDADQSVSRLYNISVTPTFLVIDAAGEIRYRGAFDNNRNAEQVSVRYVAGAIRDLLAGRPLRRPLTEASGCPLK